MQIPQQWVDVLSKIRTVFPSAKIAGGCLRDLLNDRPIKDVDIFVSLSTVDMEMDTHYNILNIYPTADLHKCTTYGVGTMPEDKDRDLEAIYTLSIGEWEYDVIFGSDKACDITTFDIGICQIEYIDHIKMSDTYIQDVANKVLRVRNTNRTDRNEARLLRLYEKYGDYTIVRD